MPQVSEGKISVFFLSLYVHFWMEQWLKALTQDFHSYLTDTGNHLTV